MTRVFCERAEQLLSSLVESAHTYIACFCENGDLLSQWREYSDHLGGHSLGFDTLQLNRLGQKGIYLRKVVYDIDTQESLVVSAIEQALALLEELTADQSVEEADNTIAAVGHVLSSHMPEYLHGFKDPSFAEEREWRLVCSFDPDTQMNELLFRTSAEMIIPYLALSLQTDTDIPLLPISEIIQGPTSHTVLITKSLLLLLEKTAYDHVELRESTVPLRF